MAKTSKKAEIIISAKDQASSTLAKVRGSVNETGVAVAKLGALAVAAGAAFAAVAAKAIDASNKQETGVRKLDAALQRAGSSYADAAKGIEEFARQQQATTRYGDDETRAVLTQLIQLTGDYGTETTRAARLVQDMAESGQSLDGATRAVGMAMAGNVQALGRYVPELRGLSQAQLDAMSSGERQRLVLDALEKQYGGTAAAIAPLDQKLANLSNTVGDVWEAFGDALKSSGALDESFDALISGLGELKSAFEDNGEAIGDVFTAAMIPAIATARVLTFIIGGLTQAVQTSIAIAGPAARLAGMGAGTITSPVGAARMLIGGEWDVVGAWNDLTSALQDAEPAITRTGDLYADLDDILARVQARISAMSEGGSQRPWWMPDAGATSSGKGKSSGRRGAGGKGPEMPGWMTRTEIPEAPIWDTGDAEDPFALESQQAESLDRLAAANRDFAMSMQEMRGAAVQEADLISEAFAQVGDAAEGYAMKAAGAAASAIDAWVSGTGSYENALAAMLASTLRSIGTEAATRALFEGAMALASLAMYDYNAAAKHGAAAAAFGAIGAVGIGVGGAMTRGGAMDRSSDRGGARGSSSVSGGYRSGSSRAYGETVTQQTVVINQYASGFVRTDRELGAMADQALRAASASGMTSVPRNG